MLLRQLFDPASWTYTYLLAEPTTGEAVMIDPVLEQHVRDTSLLRELGVKLVYVLETHLHADHVTGAWLLREHTGAEIVVPRHTGIEGADRLVDDGDRVTWGSLALEVRATPGHTPGCATYVTAGRDAAFTGDALLIRETGATDARGGDARALYRSVRERILSLPSDSSLYPAHDYAGRTVTSVREERLFNPRIGEAAREEDFVGYMMSVGLSHPRWIEGAMPANLRCGYIGGIEVALETPRWAPVVRSHSGVWELSPQWVAEHRNRVLLLDVRAATELTGELGHVEGAIHVPLDQLVGRLDEIDRSRPVVAICQSGTRSARAAQLMEKAGFTEVANMSGGLIRWNALGLPVARVYRGASL